MDWAKQTTPYLLLSGALLLAYEPLLWLLGSWYLPGYPRSGPVVFVLVLLLFGYSLSSPRVRLGEIFGSGSEPGVDPGRSVGIWLLLGSAGVRAVAQVADINLLGALVLAVDVYAIALLLGTGQRQRAVAPFWLAMVFCFCLPLEPWLQRLFGAPLQWLSAQGACGLLALGVDDLVCDGLRLSIHGVEVLVDLACSGSQLLVQASLLLTLNFALWPPRWPNVLVGLSLSLFLVWLVNAMRIALLSLGLAYRPWGIDVMAPGLHDGIGLLCFALLALAVLAWMPRERKPHAELALNDQAMPESAVQNSELQRSELQASELQVAGQRWALRWRFSAAIAFVSLVVWIVQLDARPLDRTHTLVTPYTPAVLAGQSRKSQVLTKQEQTYYQTYGGAAAKASYGSYGLLLVRTGAPIRHLHAPDVCLSGMGFEVELMGTDLSPVPTVVYRAQRAATGEAWQVRVSYVADTGEVTASLSQVAWMWLRSPGTRWTMVQRLVPWPAQALPSAGLPSSRLVPAEAAAWDQAVLRAFNLYTPAKPTRATTLHAFKSN